MKKIRDAVSKVISGISWAAMAVCFVMVFVVAIDVILRKLSGQRASIPGSNEFSAYFLIVVTMLSIPMLQIKKGHVWVNMFVDMFPKKFRSFWLGIIHAIEALVVAGFGYACVLHAMDLMKSGRVTDVLGLPFWPFALVCAIGFVEMFALLVVDTIQHFIDAAHGGEAEVSEAE